MKLEIELTVAELSAIREASARAGQPVEEFIAHAAVQRAALPPAARRVVNLHAQGYTDKEIADRTGIVRYRIQEIRLAGGLPANKTRAS